MLLYHGSNTPDIKILKPRQADHDRPYLYMTTIKIVAGFYLINTVERPYYWFPYGFEKDGTVHYQEWYPNALREAAEGKKGYIYTIEAKEEDTLPLPNIPCGWLRRNRKPVIQARGLKQMADFTLFLNSFLSYLLLFVLIAVLAVIAVAIGITMRKKKNAREAAEALTRGTEEAQAPGTQS